MEIPGLLILNCARHRCVGYQNGQFQNRGWMVVVRGNLPQDDPARKIKAALAEEIFPTRTAALEAVVQSWEDQSIAASSCSAILWT